MSGHQRWLLCTQVDAVFDKLISNAGALAREITDAEFTIEADY
jgi:hypothetical protein